MEATFRALVAEKTMEGTNIVIRSRTMQDLPPGDVIIRVAYSSLNYKDALACTPSSKVAESYPLVPGIDLAGYVYDSNDSRFREGDPVIVTGYELGVAHAGGYSEYARVPGEWIIPLPKGLTLQQSMILGTAGLTAALSVYELERNGLKPEHGPVIVTGATGGVGSTAISILARSNYSISASTGTIDEAPYLRMLGADEVLHRHDTIDHERKTMRKEIWAAAVDPVGGRTLSYLLSSMKYGGTVALSGLTGGAGIETTVYPFILRGVKLIGIDSVYCSHELRKELWERLSMEWKPEFQAAMFREITLEQVPGMLTNILAGTTRGRIIVKL